ncbi:HU family DNA-binding protein [Mycoplasma amphoriforme]|uniref:Viral histone-like protein n=1 Tax=Mycoplasma amphoriforme A39 TaxID=572419 RepID=A0A292IIC2_9MOLU|nr:unnamed protein product [Mycoplasma amphoriforme A39]
MLTKTEIFRIISECTGVPTKNVKSIFEIYTDLVKRELKSEGEIKLPDVGKFKVAISRERISRNPITGEQIKLAPKARVKFVPIKNIKEEMTKVKWRYVDEE